MINILKRTRKNMNFVKAIFLLIGGTVIMLVKVQGTF